MKGLNKFEILTLTLVEHPSDATKRWYKYNRPLAVDHCLVIIPADNLKLFFFIFLAVRDGLAAERAARDVLGAARATCDPPAAFRTAALAALDSIDGIIPEEAELNVWPVRDRIMVATRLTRDGTALALVQETKDETDTA